MNEARRNRIYQSIFDENLLSNHSSNFSWLKDIHNQSGIYFPFNSIEEAIESLDLKDINQLESADIVQFNKAGDDKTLVGLISESESKQLHFFNEESKKVDHLELSTSNSQFELKQAYAGLSTQWLFGYLRKGKHADDCFKYKSYDFEIIENTIKLKFHFSSQLLGSYEPKTELSFPSHFDVESKLKKHPAFLEHIVFNIGMVESISYWKASCAVNYTVNPSSMTAEQIDWWQELFYHGLGEYRYLNDIDTTQEDFVHISANAHSSNLAPLSKEDASIKMENPSILVPVGGGKDSLTSLHLTQKLDERKYFLLMNPTQAAKDSVKLYTDDFENSTVLIKRSIDRNLLSQNSEGFLNGHTPFSAALAMYAYLSAFIIEAKEIVLSNESSANEPTIIGTDINHQYSKSFKFEQDINRYFSNYLSNNISYFSLLRPLNETQIIHVFAKNKKHLQTFKSCNVGSKKDIWCCDCSKCLFVFILLSSEVGIAETINTFKDNLFNNKGLLQTLKELVGLADNKPFECIGTIDETREALFKIIQNEANYKDYYLLNWFHLNAGNAPQLATDEFKIETEHLLPEAYENILKDEFRKT